MSSKRPPRKTTRLPPVFRPGAKKIHPAARIGGLGGPAGAPLGSSAEMGDAPNVAANAQPQTDVGGDTDQQEMA